MMRTAFLAVALPCAALADPFVPSAAFDTCVVDGVSEEIDNFMAPILIPVLCSNDLHPIRTSCPPLQYLLLDGRTECTAQDRAYWQGEHDRIVQTYQVEPGSMVSSGLTRCAEETTAGVARDACAAEVYWRDLMGFHGAQALRAAGMIDPL